MDQEKLQPNKKCQFQKAVRYLGYVTRDCFRAFPLVLPVSSLVLLLYSALNILNPILLERMLSVAAAGEVGTGKFLHYIIAFCVLLIMDPLLTIVDQSLNILLIPGNVRYFGGKLVDFSKRIRLEALENPEVLDKFKKANMAIDDYGLSDLFFGTIHFFGRLLNCFGMVFVVGSYSMVLVPITLIGSIPSLLMQIQSEKLRVKVWRRQSTIKRRLQYLWQQFCRKDSVKEMRVMGFSDYLRDKWVEANVSVVKEMQEVELTASKKTALGWSFQNVFYALNVAVSLYLMVMGQITIAQFAACLGAFAIFQGNLQSLYFNLSDIMEMYHRAEEYYDYFTIETEKNGEKLYRAFQDKIVADNVTFRYKGADTDALKGVSCTIQKGEHVVIVGQNGSGKTTFSKLLTGAYLPEGGTLSFDGQEIQELNRESLYRHISIVPQDFVHYQFTLRENVGLGNLDRLSDSAAMEKLICEVAGEDFLAKIGNLDTQMGREFGGQELSGGEWQKVAIARGLWKESDIVILDEPTSALDPLVEYDILSKFVEMIRNKTSIIISHRVGVCRTADKIIVMKDGRVVECGRHEELLALDGEYRKIWHEQAKWYE